MLVYPTSLSNRTEPIDIEPRTEEPERGSCWNCGHMCECGIGRLLHTLCARRRDSGDGNELEHVTERVTDCPHWVHYEA